MSEMYTQNDWRDYISHSWGNSPKQKAREKEYNHWYYEKFKEEKWGVGKGNRRNRPTVIDQRSSLLSSKKQENAFNELVNSYKNGDYGSGVSARDDFSEFLAELVELGFAENLAEDNPETRKLWKEFKARTTATTPKDDEKSWSKKVSGAYSKDEYDEFKERSFAHSWGTTPEAKKRESDYNAWYWRTHKPEIMEQRRKRLGIEEREPAKDDDGNTTARKRSSNDEPKTYTGEAVKDAESFKNRTEGEIEYIKALIEANAEKGGYTDEQMANIKRHNEMIIENLEKLYSHTQSKADSYSDSEKEELYKKLNEQVDHAHDAILNIGTNKTNEYLSSIGIHRQGGSSSGSSDSNSSGNSNDEEKETMRGVYDKVLESRRKGDQQVRDLQNSKNSSSDDEDDRNNAANNRPRARETNVTGSAKSGSIRRREKTDERANVYNR